jgi:hypothetical protein
VSDRKEMQRRSGLSATEKMAVTASSATAMAILPGIAQAAIIYEGSSPVSLAMSAAAGTTVTWDVDGVDGHDFELFRSTYYSNKYIQLASRSNSYSGSALNGRGFVGTGFSTDNVLALSETFNVGPTLASGFAWGSAPYRYRTAMADTQYGANPGGPEYWIGRDFADGFTAGDNYIGFRFGEPGELHYGWATINFDTDNGIVSITEWAYEDEANTAIHIADVRSPSPVPEPSSLALLGLGASGLLGWRRRKQLARERAEA